MKKYIIKSIAAVVLAGNLTACSDFLDQSSPSSFEDTNIFAIYDLAKGAVLNIYTYFGEQNYRARQVWYGYNTDIEYYQGSEKNGDGKADLAVYDIYPINNQMNNSGGKEPWSNMYSGIEKANLVIKGLRENADLSDPRMAHLLGEALTLRALTYVDLINMWGDVPARFEPISTETIYMPRADRDDIYIQLIKDLQEAEELCAWPKELDITNTVERINKAFVKGLLARTCMQAAGSALRADGTVRTSEKAELQKSVLYPIALQACKDVMDQEAKGLVSLTPSFEKFFQNMCEDGIEAGKESLFEVGYANEPTARGRIVYTFGSRHETKDDMVGAKQGGTVTATPNLFFDYDVKDTRRDVTCLPYQWNNGKQEVSGVKKFYFGKLRYEWMKRMIASTDDGINKLYMRYADVVLMRAELENELNGPAAAAPYLKKIRQRAFKSGDWATKVDAYVAEASASKTAMFNAIVQERAFEFAGELLRKADLIRWGMLKSKMDETKQKLYALRELGSYTDGAGYTWDYSDLSGHLYIKTKDYNYSGGRTFNLPGAALDFYGLNHGETGPAPAGYQEITNSAGEIDTYIKESKIEDEIIESLYYKDPDKYMYWPIFQYNLDDNYMLENYSWYNK